MLLPRLPEDVTALRQIPDDHTASPLGSRHDVLAAVPEPSPKPASPTPPGGQRLGPTRPVDEDDALSAE